MARRRSKILSERELEVMKAVWKLGRATVREIRLEMGGDEAGAYTSIATMLKFLEGKGVLQHTQQGRTFFYMPTTTKENEQKKALQYIVNGFFDGDVNIMLETLDDSHSAIPATVSSTEQIDPQPLDKRSKQKHQKVY